MGGDPREKDIHKWAEKYGIFKPGGKTLFTVEDLPLIPALKGKAPDEIELFIRNRQKPEGFHLSLRCSPLPDGAGVAKGAWSSSATSPGSSGPRPSWKRPWGSCATRASSWRPPSQEFARSDRRSRRGGGTRRNAAHPDQGPRRGGIPRPRGGRQWHRHRQQGHQGAFLPRLHDERVGERARPPFGDQFRHWPRRAHSALERGHRKGNDHARDAAAFLDRPPPDSGNRLAGNRSAAPVAGPSRPPPRRTIHPRPATPAHATPPLRRTLVSGSFSPARIGDVIPPRPLRPNPLPLCSKTRLAFQIATQPQSRPHVFSITPS